MLDRLHSRDTALYRRWRLDGDDASPDRRIWVLLTHVGDAIPSVAVALLPVIFNQSILAPMGWQAVVSLAVSHLVVQVMKRNILRTRPTVTHEEALVVVPDRFSFPSGHATAAMSVAFSFSVSFPAIAPILLCVSSAVGLSRVRLGVHYPGDVIAGQAIAILSGIIAVSLW